MKTTKMIAAVLAVFLALALFAGAASAVPGAGTTVYVDQYNGNIGLAANTYYLYQNGQVAGSVTSDAATGAFLSSTAPVAGTYDASPVALTAAAFILKYPAVTLDAYKTGTGTSIVGTSVLKSQNIDLSISGTNGLTYGIEFTTPTGGKTNTFGINAATKAPLVFADSTAFPAAQLSNIEISTVTSGTWSAKATLKTGTVATKMVATTPTKYLNSNVITFTVGSAVTESISINKEKITRGGSVLVTFTGDPTAVTALTPITVKIDALGFMPLAGQSGITTTPADYDVTTGYLRSFSVTSLGSSGTRTLQFDSNTLPTAAEDTTYNFAATFPVTGVTKKAKVAVEKGTVTVKTSQDAYFIGNDMTISGTNTESEVVYLFIKGANVPTTGIAGYSGATPVAVESDDTWKVTFNTRTTLGALDAGTYTIYAAASAGAAPTFDFDKNSVYETTSVGLKQPFLTATAASSTVAQGDKIKITGTAEAATQVMYYIFGNNFFDSATISVDSDGAYSKEIATTGFSTGQYFVVIQHPMYDTVFNIGPISVAYGGRPAPAVGSWNIWQNTELAFDDPAGAAPISGLSLLFNTKERQSSNAAEALCQALDTQNIDDIYVKLNFIVAQPTITMNAVSDVTKGSALKVSGTTNFKEGTVVTVDVLSTAFTALDKSTVNSASFITLTTKVVKGADGLNTWEVTFDTTGLNVDSYTIQAVTEGISTSAIVKVTEAKPTATATATATATKTATATATATATPTKTPGFGAFLALAGLGAVAVLVLRRD